MAQRGNGFMEALKEAAAAIAPGLQNIGTDMKAELSRLGTQGSMEMASALFNGNAFVPYGPGQYTPSNQEQGKDVHGPEAGAHQEHQQEHGGRSM